MTVQRQAGRAVGLMIRERNTLRKDVKCLLGCISQIREYEGDVSRFGEYFNACEKLNQEADRIRGAHGM